MPVYKYNGDIYDIPEDVVADFERDMPGATLAYQLGENIYDIPASEKKGFLQTHPDAKLYDDSKPHKGHQPSDFGKLTESNGMVFKEGLNQSSLYEDEISAGTAAKMHQETRREELKKMSPKQRLEQFNQENGAFMSDYEARDAQDRKDVAVASVESGSLSMPQSAVSNAEREMYNQLLAQKKKYEKEWYTSDEYLSQQEAEAQDLAQSQKELLAERKAYNDAHPYNEIPGAGFVPINAAVQRTTGDPGVDSEKQMYDIAARINEETIKLHNAPNRYGDNSGLRNMGIGAKDKASDPALWSAGLTKITDNLGVRDVLAKIQEKRGNLNDLSEEAIEDILTPAEKAVLKAWARNAQEQLARKDNLSLGYQSGQGAVESLMYMAEFALTGGVGELASESVEGMAKWLAKNVYKVKGLADDAAEIAVRELGEKATKNIVGKYGARLVKSLAETAGKTMVMPSTYKNIAEKATEIQKDEDGNSYLVEMNDAFAEGYVDSFIENLSEGGRVNAIGELVGGVAGKIPVYKKLVDKFSKTKASELLTMLNSTGVMNTLRAGGWHGFGEEYLEEWYGNALRTILGVDKDALKNFATLDNQMVTLASFLPITIFGGTVSTGQVLSAKRDLDKKAETLRTALLDRGYSEAQADNMIDMMRGATPSEVSGTLSPIITKVAGRDTNEARELAKPAMEFAWAVSRYQSYGAKYEYQQQGQRDGLRAEMEQKLGKFWMEDENGRQTVQRGVNEKGEVVYLLGKQEVEDVQDGLSIAKEVAAINSEGKPVFVFPSDYQLEDELEMNDFLATEIMAEKGSQERTRKAQERDIQVAEIRQKAAPGKTINIGTVEAPVMAEIAQRGVDGVIVTTQSGEVRQIGYVELGKYLDVNTDVYSDADLDEQEADALSADRSQREAALDQEYDNDAEAIEELAEAEQEIEQSIEAVTPLPTKEDGSVDQNALWNNDPEGWAQWNDEQRQDGGANSLAYVSGAIAKEQDKIAELQAAYEAESDFDKRDAIEKELTNVRERILRLAAIQQSYAAQAEAQTQSTQQQTAQPVQPAPQLTEEEKAALEEERRKPLRAKAKELSEKLGVKVKLAEDLSDVQESKAREQLLKSAVSNGKQKVAGWYNQATGEVTIFLPHAESVEDVEKTFIHEVVAHKGLRGLLGEEGFNVLCDAVWDMMSESDRNRFINYPGVNGDKRAAADEYMAHFAETLNLEEAKPDMWERIVAIIKQILDSMGVRLRINQEGLSSVIAASYQKLLADAKAAQQTTNTTYQLSDEVDENGRQFVLAPNGQLAFGEITSESGLTAAPILLSEGMITNPATNDGYGLVHIEARHGDQIRKAGYNSVVEFIEEVAQNYEVIREGKQRDGIQTYMLQLTDKHNNTLMVELSGDGTYWNINTAGIFKTSYGANRKEVYNRHTTDKQSAETVGVSQVTEQSGTQPTSSMNTPTSSEDKVSNNNVNSNAEENLNLRVVESTSPLIAAAQQEGESIRFSITTEEALQDKIRKFAKTKDGKKTGWNEDQIESIIAETESLIDAIHKSSTGNEFYDEFAYKEPTIKVDWRDGEAKPIVTWTRANIEYKYDMSADLLCINNEGLEQVLSSDKMVALMEMFVPEKKAKKGEPEIKFTSEDYLELYNTLKDLGFVVPCKGCFDAAGRFKMLPSVAQKFAAEVNAVIDERNKNPEAFDAKLRAKKGDKTATGLPTTASTKSDAIAVGVAGDNLTEHVKWTQLMSADGQTKMLSDWGGIFRAWQRTGAGRPKDKLLPEPYYGDIVSSVSTIIGKYGEKTPSFRDILVNQGTGLRRNSHSEFRPVLAIDEIQFMRDAFIRNLTVFKYMKELDDVRLFGKMGVKFNMSFFPEYVPGTKVAGLDKDGNYIASEESVGSREFPYQGEDGKRHYDGMKGWAEAQKYINKDVSLSSVIFSIPHLLKALTDVPTPSDMRGVWGSLIPFHSSGATTASLAMQGLGMARANGVGHGFIEAFSDYGKGVTNFEAVQNDRFGEGWYIVSGKKAGENVEPGHKLEFANGNHYYNQALGVHLFASGYILDSELPEGALAENGELNITDQQKKALMHNFTIDYNDKVRELKGPYAYKDAADYYISELPKLGLIPRFDFEVSEEKFLEMCEAANVDPRHPKLGWKGEGNSWSPIDSEAYYSLFCDYGMTDPSTGEWAPHMPVGYVNEEGQREFRLPENAVEIVKEGLDRFSEVRRSENARIDEAIEKFAERSVEKGRISQKNVDKVLGKKSAPKKSSKIRERAEQPIDVIEEARRINAMNENADVAFRFIGEMGAIMIDRANEAHMMMDLLEVAREMVQDGRSEREIKLATGWERGADGKWRYEQPDFTFKTKPGRKKTFKLSELIEDKTLFEAYPEFKDIQVKFTKLAKGKNGEHKTVDGKTIINLAEYLFRAPNPLYIDTLSAFQKNHPEIYNLIDSGRINQITPEQWDIFNMEVGIVLNNQPEYIDEFGARETLAHEIQHAIQRVEGFARGGTASMIDTTDPQVREERNALKSALNVEIDHMNHLAQKYHDTRNKAIEANNSGNKTEGMRLILESDKIAKEWLSQKTLVESIERDLKKLKRLGDEGYKKLAGEVEARNVMSRLNMSFDERRQSLYSDTQDVATEEQIFLRKNIMQNYHEMMSPSVSFRITPEMDAEYLVAVERGDMETAQRMVIEAAKLAMPNTKVVDEDGNPKVVYHGTGSKFYTFRKTNDSNELGAGYYFSDSYEMAERYATDETLADNRFRAEDLAFEIFTDEMGHSEEDYDDNEFIDDYNKSYDLAVERLFGNGHVKSVFLNLEKPRILSRNSPDYDPYLQYGFNHYNEGQMAKRFNDGVIDEMFEERHEGLTGTQYVAFRPSQIKSADPVTYDNDGNVIPLSERFNPENNDIRFRIANENQAIFVSNAAKAVEGIKMEKATPEQWLKMIEKNGGLKAGEDKWMGLSDWLKGSDKKTLTKQEVLDFVNEHMIQIEEQHYSNEEMGKASVKILNERYQGWEDAFSFEWDGYMEEPSADISDYEAAVELYNKHHDDKVSLDEDGEFEDMDTYEKVRQFGVELSEIYHGSKSEVRPIDGTREQYTTQGLQHLHEIALTVPTIESWGLGGSNTVHFEDAGDGRAVAWIRFGDASKWVPEQREDGKKGRTKKVLVIDEIQSKRHQEGRDKGYKTKDYWPLRTAYLEKKTVYESLYDEMANKYGEEFTDAPNEEFAKRVLDTVDYESIMKAKAEFDAASDAYIPMRNAVPEAPFDKNWHELAMKRMLRYAAENGYDVIAWTKGDQQAERYNIGGVISEIKATKYPRGYEVVSFGKNGSVVHNEVYADENAMAEVYGKGMSQRIIESVDALEPSETATISGDNLRIGGEGMRGFYDRMLPAFMNKYGKKWGVKVEDIELPNLENGLTMHSVPVTEEMKASVMEGQVMFRMREEGESAMDFHQSALDDFGTEFNIPAPTTMVDVNDRDAVAVALGYTPEEFTDEQYQYILDGYEMGGSGIFDPETKKIAIFVKESKQKTSQVYNDIFHENTHYLVDKHPELLELGEWLWNNPEPKLRRMVKEKILAAGKMYEGEEFNEMLSGYTGLIMSLGKADVAFEKTPSELKKHWELIFNAFGYGPERNDKIRRRGAGDNTGGVGSIRYRSNVGEQKHNNASQEALSAEERKIIGEHFPEFNKSEDVRMRVNSQGKELTEGQKEFFANSKAVDKDGNLLVLYHGTPRAGFTEFKSGWFTTSKEDAISYSGDRKGRLFDPNEKYEPETLTAGDFRLGYMTFDSEEDRAAFLERFPYADEVMSEREYEDARMGAEDEEYDALTERRKEFAEVWNAYREYERERFVDTPIADLIANPEAYTEEDLMRAMLEYDSNASLDSLDDMSAEERKDALVSALQNANEETEGGILDMVIPTRVPRNGEGLKHNDLSNRTYEVYANVENPYEIDANGKGSEFESGDIYKAVEEALADEQYDGVIVRNWRVGRTQQLGDVVVPKDGNQIKLTSNESPTESSDIRFRTSLELDEEFGDAWRNQQNEDGRHSTQVANTKSTYEKIGHYLEDAGMKGASILDASSGLGLGTQALREMGFQVDDVEPFPSENREAPTFSSYADIDGKYDVVISNAVLNVIPDDWRADVLHQMADAVKEGGKMIINTRPASNIAQQGVEGKTRITLDSPSEILVKRGDRIAAYQKGFTSEELAEWIKSELGEGWRVEKATKKNSGISGEGTAVVIKEGDNVSFRTTGTPTDEVVANGLQLTPAQTAEVAANIFAALPEESRKKITEGLNGNVLGLKDAILQIPASLASKENWNDEDKQMAAAVRDVVQDLVDENPTTRSLTTKEALWMLYDSTYEVKDLVDAASRAFVAHNLGFDQASMQRKAEVDDYVRFRSASNSAIDAATDMYDYETSLWTERLKESWLDMNQSVIGLQKAMAEASKMPIESWENLEFALNRLSSKSYADKKKYLRDFLMPMWDTILDIVKHDSVSIEEIERYMMLKHGLERNKKFASRDAREFYRAMYDLVAERMKNQSHAQQVVALSEAKKRLADIDAQIAVASSSQLPRLNEARARAQYDIDVAELVLRGDEKQNETELQAYYDAIDNEADPKYREFREKDYGGLTSMFVDTTEVKRSGYKSEAAYQKAVLAATTPKFDKVADMEAEAEMEVDAFESKVYMYRALWDKVNAATKETLRHQYESGMITLEQYEAVRDMFEFYIPLRGFADNTAEDMYSYYMNNSAGGFAKPILGAKGRKTRAESPLGWIGTMAESAIQADNKNEAKMCLYYITLRRPDQNLLTITETWYEYAGQNDNGKKIFKVAYPPATDRALNADELRQHMEDWENDMKQKQSRGEAYKGSQRVDLKGSVIFQDEKEEKEHVVRVKVAGKDYSILVNGNPRAAQAINGMLNPDVEENAGLELYKRLQRFVTSGLTSASHNFWLTNFQRDLMMSIPRMHLKYGASFAAKYAWNRHKAWRVFLYLFRNEKEPLGDSYFEKLYTEFAENGGVTGYTVLASNKEYEEMFDKYIKEAKSPKLVKFFKAIKNGWFNLGEAIEQVSRFAAFITAREDGKSIEEAINAAKEVSVNFNRKGSAKSIKPDEIKKLRMKNGLTFEEYFDSNIGKVSPKAARTATKAMEGLVMGMSSIPYFGRLLYFFFNAGVQSTSSLIRLARQRKGAALSWYGFYAALGLLMAEIIGSLWSDDDEEVYRNLPEYERRNNILIPVGDGVYFKWAISQELRTAYGMGDALSQRLAERSHHKKGFDAVWDFAGELTDFVPINPFESYGLYPDLITTYAEIKHNKSGFGSPIYKEYSWKSDEEMKHFPKYRLATPKTNPIIVDMTRVLNDATAEHEGEAGWINWNPAGIEHALKGYLGGRYTTMLEVYYLSRLLAGKDEFMIKNTPFIKRLLLSTDEVNMYSLTNEQFAYYKGIADNAKRVEKEYRESDDPSRADAYREEEDWRIYLLYKEYERDFKDVKERLDNAVDKEEEDILKQEQNVLREMFLDDIAKGDIPEVTFQIREDVKRFGKEIRAIMKPATEANKKRLERKRAGDEEGMLEAIEQMDSLKNTPEYQRAEDANEDLKEIRRQIKELGSVTKGTQRDSIIGEMQRNYDSLVQKMERL